ncbi:MAG: aldo/keto reductase [Lachnospiraceae bacterium]
MGGEKRLFITSKVWNDMHEKVENHCRQSLKDLGLETIDLFSFTGPSRTIMHWLQRRLQKPGFQALSVDEFMKTRRQCEELVDQGLVCASIGMSNMTVPKLEAVLPLCRIKPAALEMELHPSFPAAQAFRLCSEA